MNVIRLALPLAFALGLATLSLSILSVSKDAVAADRRETRNVPEFSAIGLSAPIVVKITQADSDSLVLEGDERDLDQIETWVENRTLKIRAKRDRKWRRHAKVVAHVTARRIDALAISGSGDIVAPKLEGESLNVSVSGSGDVSVGGKVNGLTANIAGSGDIRAGRLEAQRVKVSIAGSGDTTVWARQSLSASVAGSGDIRFYGDPAVQKSIVGSGSVKRLGAAPS
jgi:putative autotransporter adhesin-like protein